MLGRLPIILPVQQPIFSCHAANVPALTFFGKPFHTPEKLLCRSFCKENKVSVFPGSWKMDNSE
jgi:hypothetical protein